MSNRNLYIAAYDVRSPRRLHKALHVLKDFACGGQKSVFECWLDSRERDELLARIKNVIDLSEDRFLVVPVPGGQSVHVMGIGVAPADPAFFYVG